MPPHLDAQEVALLVPVHVQVLHVEEVLLAQLGARGHLHEHDLGRLVLVLGDPQRDEVVRGRPVELLHAVYVHLG